ncbi:MAG: hypothetical protein P8182_15200, partial [Deltaproteobacteria bacterium]
KCEISPASRRETLETVEQYTVARDRSMPTGDLGEVLHPMAPRSGPSVMRTRDRGYGAPSVDRRHLIEFTG